MADMNINPEELINNLSQQIGALMAENTDLKMAIGKTQESLDAAERQLAALTPAPEDAGNASNEGDSKKKK